MVDIGPFFITDCCTEAGFDHLGRKESALEDLGLNTEKVSETLKSEATESLNIVDDPKLDGEPLETEEEKKEAPAKPKRQYSRRQNSKKES